MRWLEARRHIEQDNRQNTSRSSPEQPTRSKDGYPLSPATHFIPLPERAAYLLLIIVPIDAFDATMLAQSGRPVSPSRWPQLESVLGLVFLYRWVIPVLEELRPSREWEVHQCILRHAGAGWAICNRPTTLAYFFLTSSSCPARARSNRATNLR